MSHLLKKILVSFLLSLYLFIVSLSSLPLTTHAQEATWYNTDFKTFFGKVYGEASPPSEIFGERYTAAQVQWVIYSLFGFMIKNSSSGGNVALCLLAETDPLSCTDEIQTLIDLINSVNTSQTQSYKQSTSLASMVFDTNRPISALSYVKQKVNKFDLVPEAQAQTPGFGFSALAPIQDMWRGARDIAFGLFVITAIVFAFMIMFRVKINPQTVITVQSAIPKVIGALIAVTFSYAIAGLLIDLMYVVIGVLSLAFAPFLPSVFLGAATSNPVTLLFGMMTTGFFNLGILGSLFVLGLLLFFPLLVIIATTSLIAGLFTASAGWWIGLIGLLIVAIVYLWISFKTIWALFKAFANVVLLTIFGPLQMALGVLIPNFGIGAWARSYFSQLSVFITTGLLSVLSMVFAVQSFVVLIDTLADDFGALLLTLISTIFGGLGFSLGTSAAAAIVNASGWPPLLNIGGGYGVALVLWGVAFVLFTMIPKATELVQSFLAGKPFAYGSAIGEAFGPIRWAGGKAWDLSGGRDMAEIAQIARKSRILNKVFGEGGFGHNAALWWIGGPKDEAKTTLNTMADNYTKRSGPQVQ